MSLILMRQTYKYKLLILDFQYFILVQVVSTLIVSTFQKSLSATIISN